MECLLRTLSLFAQSVFSQLLKAKATILLLLVLNVEGKFRCLTTGAQTVSVIPHLTPLYLIYMSFFSYFSCSGKTEMGAQTFINSAQWINSLISQSIQSICFLPLLPFWAINLLAVCSLPSVFTWIPFFWYQGLYGRGEDMTKVFKARLYGALSNLV